ncbi:integrin beta-1-like [Antennarius striatus]|uniref:integrin beta-1-like n=1 Tax=Antennarius striatus TaxID=241820 RepID=UPI0035B41C45
MDLKLLCLFLLLVLISHSCTKKQTCPKSASNCDECIQSSPKCVWCASPSFSIRCNTLKGLQRAGCPKQYMYNPQSGVEVLKNESSTEPMSAEAPFLQPQELSLRLRPGASQSFPLTITMPTDQPVTELKMDISPLPAGVNITLTTIDNRNPMVVQVNVGNVHCASGSVKEMQNRTGPWSFYITPRQFPMSVKLNITLECQCGCTRDREEYSLGCSGHGALVCGRCECYSPYVGQQCQTDAYFSLDERACRSGPNAPLCSGRGKCVEGFCECDNREKPEEKYSGQFCQCSNFDCPRFQNRICGGHGKCQCGNCVCDDDWMGEDCSCSMETATCMAYNQMLCNGRGSCQCGTCMCTPPYMGATCEDCPTCIGVCQQHRDCVECRAFGTGRKKNRCDEECGYLTVRMVELKQEITEPLCSMRSREDSCIFHYTYSRTPSGGQLIVLRDRDCPRM